MHIFFSVGEPSGDQHAALLMQELQSREPNVRVSGFGGPLMEQHGLDSLHRLTDLAVMGFMQVAPLLAKFFRLVKQAEQFLAAEKPDAVVLVDFPGFNWWIAKKAKALGIPVFYYMPPQLWAWAPWRIKRVQRFVDYVLSGLPFERDWYEEHGVKVDYVGHPFFDEVAEHSLDQRFLDLFGNRKGPTVAVLPGSRTQEVNRNWPLMLETMRRVHARHPDTHFLVANYREHHRRRCVTDLLTHAPTLPVSVYTAKTSEIIEVADCALMVSGSVSLEMIARQTPAAVVYRGDWMTYFIATALVTCKYISLPNLIAGRKIMPEFPTVGNPSKVITQLTDVLDRWLRLPEERERVMQELDECAAGFRDTGATIRTAEVILSRISGAEQPAGEQQSKAA